MRAFRRRAQRRDLTRRESPVAAAWQIAELHGTERDAAQSSDTVAERIAVALDLVLAPLRERQSQERGLPTRAEDLDVARSRGTVVEHDAAAPALERSCGHAALHLRLINPR